MQLLTDDWWTVQYTGTQTEAPPPQRGGGGATELQHFVPVLQSNMESNCPASCSVLRSSMYVYINKKFNACKKSTDVDGGVSSPVAPPTRTM